MDVSIWLWDLGLEDYAQAFRANHIDAEVLSQLTAEDLIALGITSIGHRRKLLAAIAALDHGRAPAAAERIAVPARPLEAERRQLTVLFCDLVGSTELAARLDPEDLRDVMRAYQKACADVITRFGGHVDKPLGDGVPAYFGWPRAHENDAERAVRAGLQLVRDIARLEPRAEVQLQARVGVATGRVVVGDLISEGMFDKDAVSGDTPNLAARLQDVAAPGGVVISKATRRLVGGLFELTDLGPLSIKGFAEPLPVWRVEGESRAEGRFEALHAGSLPPLVGRERELSILLERWVAAKGGHGQVVLLLGEAGIGKSRLVREVRARLEDEPHVSLLYQCSPHHTTSPLHPLIEQLQRAARFEPNDSPEARLDKLEALLARSTGCSDEAAPLIATLLGLPIEGRYPPLDLTPQREKQRTLEVLVDHLEGLTVGRPVLLVYEDVHWVDPTTRELLGLAIDRIQRLTVLAIVTFRPDFQPPWAGRAHVTTLALSPLGRRQGADLVARVAGEKPLPAEVREQIVARSDGVPLFLEELTKTALESCLLRDAVARYGLAAPLPVVAIPSTLHDSLLARLDRVAPAKEIAQIGAVIGQEFPYALLAAVADQPEAHLQAALDHLVASELVFRRGAPPEATYTFKHALVQDAAYQSLLRSKRQQLHARIATVLEEQFPETVETQPELLARHCTHAGPDLIEKAVKYWSWAGRQAMARPAIVEAAALLTQALDLLAGLPSGRARGDKEFALLIDLGAALIAIKGVAAPEVERVKTRARELHPEEDPNPQLLSALYHLFLDHLDRSSNEAARQIAEKLVFLAEKQKNDEMGFVGHYCMAVSLFSNGQFAPALKHFRNSLTHRAHLASPARPDIRVACLLFRALILMVQGYSDQALEARVEGQAVALGLRSDLRRQALFLTGWFHQVCREPQVVEELGQELIGLDRDHGRSASKIELDRTRDRSVWAPRGAVLHGWAVAVGRAENAGIDELLEGLEAIKDIGVQLHTPGFVGLLAELYIDSENFGGAIESLEDALARAGRLEERWFEADLRRLKGEALLGLSQDHSAEAEECFHDALKVARDQGAHLWELRAATSLARLWCEQGRYAEAQDLLAPVYGWFQKLIATADQKQAFDTADLKDAKALLDELA
jgi:class 3 adenylate cyclase/tetratricopeptide (TPR) repeat protein